MFPNQHIRIISEVSCDTENWSNDAENSTLITGINYKLFLNSNILQYYRFYCIHHQINAALVSKRDVKNINVFHLKLQHSKLLDVTIQC